MIPTTFIFGAGTCKPLGFPLGIEMVNDTIYSIKRMLQGSDDTALQFFRETLGDESERKLSILHNALEIGDYPSLDRCAQVLEDLEPIIKLFIAIQLLKSESLNLEAVNTRISSEPVDNAYQTLWRYMVKEIDILQEIYAHSYITFNYDRTLEHYLYSKFTHALQQNPDLAIESLTATKIVHVYGDLGQYNPQKVITSLRKTTPPQPNYEAIRESAERINIVPYDHNRIVSYPEIVHAFAHTKRVVILGFGYDEKNCQILRRAYAESKGIPEKQVHQDIAQYWYSSAYKLPGSNRQAARQILGMDPKKIMDSIHKTSSILSMLMGDAY